MRKPLKP